MIKRIRKYWLITLLIVMTVLLIGSAVLRVLTPPAPPIVKTPELSQNFDGSTSEFRNVRFTGQPLTIPSELKVVKITPSELSITQVINELTNTYQLTPSPRTKDSWDGPSYSLRKDQYNGYYILNGLESEAGSTQKVSVGPALEQARSFFAQFFPGVSIQPITDHISYLTGGVEPSNTTIENAAAIVIPFAYKVDEYPIFYKTQSDVPFTLVLDARNQLQRLFFYPQFITTSELFKKKTLTTDQAMENISQGNAIVINAYQEGGTKTEIKEITSANFSLVTLEYRVDEQQQIAYPYYRFRGTGKNRQGNTLDLEVLTPAIEVVQSAQ